MRIESCPVQSRSLQMECGFGVVLPAWQLTYGLIVLFFCFVLAPVGHGRNHARLTLVYDSYISI
ncbi:hypothetical protein M378DRAFT_165682 [Amanita muscaria Koide BX008]|uniref:Uncharacterized protein n=1 Tax=Amanita muscaria (strain Koide BX008) TaxID=946122 RepID=A0A0C2SH67_AMAMK|nr:hypothetical protein M378DRAFT_165682 [Amanita muscaria Koide BX008]